MPRFSDELAFTKGNENREMPHYPNAYAALPVSDKGITCPHTGLRHAHLAKLLKPGGMAAGHVRVIALREPGARHGKTLFHVGDMLRWLDGLATKQNSPSPQT